MPIISEKLIHKTRPIATRARHARIWVYNLFVFVGSCVETGVPPWKWPLRYTQVKNIALQELRSAIFQARMCGELVEYNGVLYTSEYYRENKAQILAAHKENKNV